MLPCACQDLNYLEPDRLLFQFRFYAGLANKVEPYGGWESPDYVNINNMSTLLLPACSPSQPPPTMLT